MKGRQREAQILVAIGDIVLPLERNCVTGVFESVFLALL